MDKYVIKEFVKAHNGIYRLYFYVMSFIINVIKLFVRSDEKLILFVSYGGKHFSDSPKNIYEGMLRDERFKDYRFVWGFVSPENFNVEGAEKVKLDTIKYYVTALKARAWITNVMIERALKFTGKKTYYLCTNHGIPLKGLRNSKPTFTTLSSCLYDNILAQSEVDVQLQIRNFNIDRERIVMCGYPRNDKFSENPRQPQEKVRRFFGIPNSKKIILYAPTYRDWNNGIETSPLHVKKWENALNERFVLLYRAHPTVRVDLQESDFFKDASKYEDLDELLIATDLLVSDYSSLFFDYSITHKPMICWAYDYKKFSEYRELRVDLVNELYGGEITEDELIEKIVKSDFSKMIERTRIFQEKYVTVFGNATKKSLDLIYSRIH